MNKTSQKFVLVATLALFIIPQVTFAAWWNPLSWGIFSSIFQSNTSEQTQITIPSTVDNIVATSSDQISTTTISANVAATSTTKSTPVSTPSSVTPKTNKPVVKTPPANQPTGTLCNGTYWNACPVGQKLVCPQTGNAYCQLPVQQPQTVVATTTSAVVTTPATTTVDKGTPYKGQDGNWYYPNAYGADGRNLQVPGPDITVTASQTSVPYDGSATISWTAKGAASCTMNSSPVLLASSGSQTTGNLETSTTYTFTCTKNDGSSMSGNVTVNVQPWVPPPGVKVLPAGQCTTGTAPCTTGPNGWSCSRDGCGG